MAGGPFVQFNVCYVADVLAKLLSDQRGTVVTATVIKKTPEELKQMKKGG